MLRKWDRPVRVSRSLPVDRLVSHRLKPEQINEGFDRLERGEAVRQVVVLD